MKHDDRANVESLESPEDAADVLVGSVKPDCRCQRSTVLVISALVFMLTGRSRRMRKVQRDADCDCCSKAAVPHRP